MKPHHIKSRVVSLGGFSLIELLVVVSIIAVLAGMLFPAMGLVRTQARAMACSGNLRQVGIATQVYTEDNGGLLPYALDKTGDHWYELLAGYAEVSDSSSVTYGSAEFKRRNILTGCTEYRRDPSKLWRVGYGYNRRPLLPSSDATLIYSSADAASGKFRNIALTAIYQPGSRPMFGCSDEWTLGVSASGPWWSYGGNWDLHGRQSNWLCYDLHLESMPSSRAVYRLYDPALYQ